MKSKRKTVSDVDGIRYGMRIGPNLVRRRDIRRYLDSAIRHWRRKRDVESPRGAEITYSRIAPFYVDAFQNVRISLFGKTLPPEPRERRG